MTSSVDRGALESLLALAPLIIGGLWLLAALTAFMTISIRSDRPLALLSKFDKSHATSIEQIVRRQWSQMKSAKYILQLPFRKVYVLPAAAVNEYAWKPDSAISSNGDLQERLLGRWSFIGSLSPEEDDGPYHRAVQYTRTDLTRQISSYLPAIQQEISDFLRDELSTSSGWNSVKIHDFCIALCFRVYQKVFVGPELCQNAEWKAACIGHGTSAVGVAGDLMKWPSWLRPMVAPFLKAPQDVKKHVATMERLVRPVLMERLRVMQQPNYEAPKDFIQWWIERGGASTTDARGLVIALLQLNFAGIRSTGVVIMQVLIDLAMHADCATDMQKEIGEVLNRAGEAQPSTSSLAKMVLVDSFIKESQRHVPQNVLSVYRKTMQRLTLSDGTIIPQTSYVCVPSMDPDARSATGDRPFDGFRWARLRHDRPADESKYLSVAAGPQNLEFGAGAHACPGRFVAMSIAKSVVAQVLMGYSVRLPEGRPVKPLQYNKVLVLIPDREQGLEIRSVA